MKEIPRKTEMLRFLVDKPQRRKIEIAAEMDGLTISAWLRRLALNELKRVFSATRK